MATNQDTPTEIHPNGTMEWLNAKGERHRDGDKPAVIYADGTRVWYQRGKIHRDGDKPAVIHADGDQGWWWHGKIHRDGGKPAVIHADGTQCWYQYGLFVRSESMPTAANPAGTSLAESGTTAAKPTEPSLEVAIERWRAAVRTMKAARASILDAMDAEERL